MLDLMPEGPFLFFLVRLFYFLIFACFWRWLKKFKKFNFFALLLRHFSDSCLIRFFACLFFCCFLFLFLRFCELLCLLLFLCSFACASVFFCFCLSANLQFCMSAFLFFCRWILLCFLSAPLIEIRGSTINILPALCKRQLTKHYKMRRTNAREAKSNITRQNEENAMPPPQLLFFLFGGRCFAAPAP